MHASAYPITIVPTTASIPDSNTVNSIVTPLTVVMSDGSTYTGPIYITSDPDGLFALSGYNLTLGVNLSPGNDGAHPVTISTDAPVLPGIACDVGPRFTGTIPAPATSAGFTHCAANYDFSNAAYADPTTWLDCKGATSPQWWNLSYATTNPAPCARYNIVADAAFGTNAFQSLYLPSDWGPYPAETSTEIDTTNSPSPTPGTSPGFFFATQFYVDVAEYVTASTQNSTYSGTSCGSSPSLLGGAWTWAFPEKIETDFMEFYPGLNSCTNGGNTFDHDTNAIISPGSVGAQPGTQGGYNATIPHTYGTLQTANGTTFTRCNYMDGVQLGSGCASATFATAAITSKSWLKITIGPEVNSAGSQPAVTEDLRVQRITVWECPGYKTGNC
jgi:hypothetical protein